MTSSKLLTQCILAIVPLTVPFTITHAAMEILPTNQSLTTTSTAANVKSNVKSNLQNGSDYYTIPNKDTDSEPVTSQRASATNTSQVPDIVPFDNFDKLPDQPITPPTPPANKKLPANKSAINKPNNSQIPVTGSAPVTKNNSSNATKAPVKEKIIPMAKKVNLKFADFPVKVYTGKRVTPKINELKSLNSFYGETLAQKGKKSEQQFIQSLSKAKPNFAGHYVVTSFTCGLNCSASVAYDVKTGGFMELGGGFADCPATDFNPRQKASITHQANSRLLIVIGSSSSGTCMAGYFEERDGNVSLINQKNLMTYVP